MPQATKNKRTVYVPNRDGVLHYAAKLASNGNSPTGYPAAIKFMQACFIAQKGNETRPLSDTEASVLIKRYLE